MNAYDRIRRRNIVARKDRPIVRLIGIVVFGWIGIGLGLLILEVLREVSGITN
jgi:hypothetical protein